jgi:RimJ/RimL family protein N-acetyltransferase
MRIAPVLETERLVLRPHGVEDWADCVALWADPEVTRHIGGQPSTAEQTWSRLVRYAGLWSLLGYGYWAICEKATGRFAGEAGFADFKRDIHPSFEGTPEIGWALARWAHGRGYGTEAVRAVVSWGDTNLESPRTVCLISPSNAASISVARKCGYTLAGEREYKGQLSSFFARDRA